MTSTTATPTAISPAQPAAPVRSVGTRSALALVAVALMAATLGLVSPASASASTLPPSSNRPMLTCSSTSAVVNPAPEVNPGGAPGWVYSIFYVHDSRTGRWTTSDWVISYGGAGWQPSYLWTERGWVQLGVGGIRYAASQSSTQTLYELRYTQNQVIAHSNTWTHQWVGPVTCSTNVQSVR